MRATITAETVEVGNVVYVVPDGKRSKVAITATSIVVDGNRVVVSGVRASGLPVRSTMFHGQPVSWELS